MLEALEERLVPSTWVVRDTSDNSPRSLRAAIQSGIDEGGAQTIDCRGVQGTITLQSPLPDFTSFTILGPGSANLEVTRNPQAISFRIFETHGTCSIQGLEISGGSFNSGGGGIWNNGFLTLTDCWFQGNNAADGGALYSTCSVSASNCWFGYNTAWRGGAIFNFGGDLDLENCALYFNTARQEGGGLYNCDDVDPGRVTMQSTDIYNNTAGNLGGGIYNVGQLQMVDGSLQNNQVNPSAPGRGSGWGGGYYGAGGSASIIRANILGNSATNRGGGFYLQAGTLGFQSCTISNNTAPNGPGGYIQGGTYNDPIDCVITDDIVRG
jgi:predicted outer membrane repeat protein